MTGSLNYNISTNIDNMRSNPLIVPPENNFRKAEYKTSHISYDFKKLEPGMIVYQIDKTPENVCVLVTHKILSLETDMKVKIEQIDPVPKEKPEKIIASKNLHTDKLALLGEWYVSYMNEKQEQEIKMTAILDSLKKEIQKINPEYNFDIQMGVSVSNDNEEI